MIRKTSTSYAGRQLDIEMLKHIEIPAGRQRVHPNVHDSPRIVSGIEKAVQRYAKLFLTNLGSVKTARGVGSELLPSVKTGRVSNTAYLSHLCSAANLHALLAMKEDDENTDKFGVIPDDEFIVSTRIVKLSLDRGSSTANVHIFIETAAGDGYTFVVPVSAGIEA